MICWKKVFFVVPLLLTACTLPAEQLQRQTVWVMDTACTVALCGGETEKVTDLLDSLSAELDNYANTSTVSLLNRKGTMKKDDVLYPLAAQTQELQVQYGTSVDLTIGALTTLWNISTDNPHIPSEKELELALKTVSPENLVLTADHITLQNGAQLDLGAVAKGYALDKVQQLLDETGETTYATISMTSSILFYGEKPEEEPFLVEVRNPNGDGILGTIRTKSCFLSTSGGYERYFTADDGTQYSHILSAKTGMPAQSDLTTVTVLCDSGLESDFLSTLIWLEGTENIETHLKAPSYQVVAQGEDGTLYVSEGLDFTPAET